MVKITKLALFIFLNSLFSDCRKERQFDWVNEMKGNFKYELNGSISTNIVGDGNYSVVDTFQSSYINPMQFFSENQSGRITGIIFHGIKLKYNPTKSYSREYKFILETLDENKTGLKTRQNFFLNYFPHRKRLYFWGTKNTVSNDIQEFTKFYSWGDKVTF